MLNPYLTDNAQLITKSNKEWYFLISTAFTCSVSLLTYAICSSDRGPVTIREENYISEISQSMFFSKWRSFTSSIAQ